MPPSRVKQPVAPVKHVFVLDKLARVGLLDASLYSSDKAGLIFEHADYSVFHQLLGIFTMGRGHLLKSRFHVGREMYFHTLSRYGENPRRSNALATLLISGKKRSTTRSQETLAFESAFRRTFTRMASTASQQMLTTIPSAPTPATRRPAMPKF